MSVVNNEAVRRRAGKVCSVEAPLIRNRGNARSGRGKNGGASHAYCLILGLEGEVREFTFGVSSGRVNRGDFRSRQIAVVESDFIEISAQAVVRETLSGGAEIQREISIILRKRDIGLPFELPVNVKLDKV